MVNEMRENEKSITIKDIAAYCGVGKSIVSYALRGEKKRMRPETFERIIDAAKTLGYDPQAHEAARRMVAKRMNQSLTNHLISLYFPNNALNGSNYYAQLMTGTVEAVNNSGFSVLFESLPEDWWESKTVIEVPSLIRRGEVDGVIGILSPIFNERVLLKLRETYSFRDRPVVSLIFTMPDTLAVLADDEQGGYDSARHLLELGHKNILFVTFSGDFSKEQFAKHKHPAYNRYCGIRKAITEAGINFDTGLHLFKMPVTWLRPGLLPIHHTVTWHKPQDDDDARLIIEYLRAHPEITAIIAHNDVCAFQLWAILNNAGYNIPEDISIIGFDDTEPVYNESGLNQLSTIRVPLTEIGHQAAMMVTSRVNGIETPDKIVLPTALKVRHSTAVANK